MDIRPFGDQALLINFEQAIREDVNQKVIDLKDAIEAAHFPGISYLIPAYCSLVVGFEPDTISYRELKIHLKSLKKDKSKQPSADNRNLRVPVCYESQYGIDMEEVARQTGLDIAEIIDLHCSAKYRVFMLGFLPGFAYMGPLPSAMYCPRKATPRIEVPANSVAIAGNQTGIYPAKSPGGWHIVGRTPIPSFREAVEQPFTFQPGDQVNFYAIDQQEFDALFSKLESGDFNWDSFYE